MRRCHQGNMDAIFRTRDRGHSILAPGVFSPAVRWVEQGRKVEFAVANCGHERPLYLPHQSLARLPSTVRRCIAPHFLCPIWLFLQHLSRVYYAIGGIMAHLLFTLEKGTFHQSIKNGTPAMRKVPWKMGQVAPPLSRSAQRAEIRTCNANAFCAGSGACACCVYAC